MTERLRGRRIVVTGAGGRLGSVMTSVLVGTGAEVLTWSRPRYDLDDPSAAGRLVSADRPDLVVHCAAWVDVDGCAQQPDLAGRRNSTAVAELAAALAGRGADLVLISTNEVFDGTRTDGEGYTEADPPSPANPYGASKLRAEQLATAAYEGASGALLIVRTSWLYGPAGNDFPEKILRAADRADGKPLRVVHDEVGSPTSIVHLSRAIAQLAAARAKGTYHRVGSDIMSRYEWAADLLTWLRPSAEIEPVTGAEFARSSVPPAWGVLASSEPMLGTEVVGWKEARGAFLRDLRARDRAQPHASLGTP